MKKFRFLLPALAMFAAIGLWSCSDADEPTPDIDKPVTKGAYTPEEIHSIFGGDIDNTRLRAAAAGKEGVAYTRTNVSFFNMDSQTNGKWEAIDVTVYDGLSYIAPSEIAISEGSTFSPLILFSSSLGPSIVATPWEVYKRRTGWKKDIFIQRPVEFDAESNTLTLNGWEYTVERSSADTLVLSTTIKYSGGRNDKGGQHLEISVYTKSELSAPELDAIATYPSDLEAKLDMTYRMREHFGPQIDINHYLTGVRLDHSLIDFDLMEEALLNGAF